MQWQVSDEMFQCLYCTQNDKETHKDGRKGPHAEAEDLSLLHQLAVGTRETGRTETRVSLRVVSVNASSSVQTRIVQTLVPIFTTLAIRSHSLAPWTPRGHANTVSRVSRVDSHR